MPILDIQQKQAQVGRIRMGDQQPTKNGKTRPARLDKFRFTTPQKPLADAIAKAYGGETKRWEPDGRPAEWEVYTTADAIPVLVPPRPVSQWYELWTGAGCVRRCDGETEQQSMKPCMCPPDPHQRADLAGNGNACKITTRLNVMLPQIPGIGVWRLDTHGFYAALELPSTAEFLGAATASNGYIIATLTIEQRQVRRPGVGVRQFPVPALHVDVTPLELMAGGGIAIGAGVKAIESSTPERTAIENRPDDDARRAQAEGFAAEARAATSRDDVMAVWQRAKQANVLDVQIADDEDILTQLNDFIGARGKALTSAATPTGDADTLWMQILGVADEQGWDLSRTRAAFLEVTGADAGTATAEQMTEFLAHITSVTA